MKKLIRTKLFVGAAALLFVFIALLAMLANMAFSRVTTKAAESCLVAGTDFTLSGSDGDLKATLGDGYSLVGQAGSGNYNDRAFVSASNYSRKKATIIKFTNPIETNEIKIMRLGISKNISATAYFDFYANNAGSLIDGNSAVRRATVSSVNDAGEPTYIALNTVDYADENGVIDSIVVVHESDDRQEGDYPGFSARFFSIDYFGKTAEYDLIIGTDFVLTGENRLGLTFPSAVGPVTESATGKTKYYANGINSANGTVVRFTQKINIADYNTAVIEYKLGANTYPRSLVFVKNQEGAVLSDRDYVFHTDSVKEDKSKQVSVDLRALANEGKVESFVFSLDGETVDNLNVYGITLKNVNYGEEKELEPYVGYHLRSDPDLSDKLVGSFNDSNVSGDNFVSTKAGMTRGYGTAVKFAERVSTDEYSAITFDISKNTSNNVVFAIYRLEKDGNAVKTFTVGGANNQTTAVTIRLADIAIDGKCEGFILVHESDDRSDDFSSFSVRIYPISLKTYRQVSFEGENVDITTQTLAYGDVITEPTAPTKDKDDQFVYSFDGWYVGETKWDFSTPVTENVVLTARFIETKIVSVKMSVALSEDIIVRFAFDDSAYTDIEFTVNGIKAEKIDGKYLYDEIVPQYLGKELVINVTGKNSDGETVRLVNDKRYSVKEYLFGLLGKTADELGYTDEQFGLMKSLVTDLLYYGKAAQDYTGYETDNYVTAGLGESPSTFVCPTSVKNTTDNTGDYTWYSAKLSYSNKIRLVFTVLGTEQPTSVTFNVGGKEISVTQGILKGSEDGKNKYEYVLDISLVDFDTAITGKIVVGGQTLAPQITYSVASYIAVQTANPLIGEVEKELLKRAYCYGVSAAKFAKSI